MDQGTQEEVGPYYSYVEKVRTVATFVRSRYTIITINPVTEALNRGFVAPLANVPFRMSPTYTPQEASAYFDWLVAVCSGTQKATKEYIKEATEQLFTFLLFMKNHIQIAKDPFATPSIEDRLDLIANKLDVISNHQISELFHYLEMRDKKITDILEKLYLFVKAYGPTLEQVRKDYEATVGKIGGKKD